MPSAARPSPPMLPCLAALALAQVTAAQLVLAPDAPRLVLDRGLAIAGVADSGRRPINTDAIVAGLIDGSIDPLAVKPGDAPVPGRTWRELDAAGGGFAPPGRGSYVLVRVDADAARVMLLDAAGHAMVYVNGEPRMGDPYAYGYVTLPVALRTGANWLLFTHAGRGPMRAALRQPESGVLILGADLTLPDARPDAPVESPIGVPVVNATAAARRLVVRADAGAGQTLSAPFTLPAASAMKVALSVRAPAAADGQPVPLRLAVLDADAEVASHTAALAAPPAGAAHKITFLSRVDASAQYISIVPPAGGDHPPALVLSLHGASVEATNQAASYAPRRGYLIACPTNRRPFGFDWEDWGRIDALEAMDHVKARFNTDPTRQYLTGHSMGGHGTWNLGVLFPDRFAALAPSAGWLSFDTYPNRSGATYAPATPLGQAFRTARASSMTLDFFPNLRGKGVYILHGDADDNVPVQQARDARAELDRLGIPHRWHEQAGAGHWWDDDAPGAACLDWPGIWETFAASRLDPAPAPLAVPAPVDARGFPVGAFKRAFDREFVLVYSTGGTPAENAWSLAKARFDAEQWWYRGNGRAPIVSDADFLADPTQSNVILYGNADTNRAWTALVGDAAPLKLTRGGASIDGKPLTGDDIACLAVLPRADRRGLEVGVVGGTGLPGARATERLPYFTSGVGFPDVTLLRAGSWRTGFEGVEAAGVPGRIVWR